MIESVHQFQVAGAWAICGNLLTYGVVSLLRYSLKRQRERQQAAHATRVRRVAAVHICEGCHYRGRDGHAWSCPSGDIPFFNYHDMNTHVGWDK